MTSQQIARTCIALRRLDNLQQAPAELFQNDFLLNRLNLTCSFRLFRLRNETAAHRVDHLRRYEAVRQSTTTTKADMSSKKLANKQGLLYELLAFCIGRLD